MISNRKSVSPFSVRRPTLYPSELIALAETLFTIIQQKLSIFSIDIKLSDLIGLGRLTPSSSKG